MVISISVVFRKVVLFISLAFFCICLVFSLYRILQTHDGGEKVKNSQTILRTGSIHGFGSKKYQCHGNCYCHEPFRRTIQGMSLTRKLSTFVIAVSSLLAARVAKTQFEDDCLKLLSDDCDMISIHSELDECVEEEFQNNIKLSDGDNDDCDVALKCLRERVGLFVIDPQNSFTKGSWMLHFGEDEVTRLKRAFENVGEVLAELQDYEDVPIIFSKCYTFGYDAKFDESVREIAKKYESVLKPGNSIYHSPQFGKFERFIEEELLGKNISNLVIGGCTLNSCVRVSSIHIKEYFKNLNVIVDLSMCGARDSNYERSRESDWKFDGKTPVEAAINQMKYYGVMVVDKYEWFKKEK